MTEPGKIPKQGDMRNVKNVFCYTIANSLNSALCTCVCVQVLLRESRGQEREDKQEKTERIQKREKPRPKHT